MSLYRMENNSNAYSFQQSNNPDKEIKPTLYGQNLKNLLIDKETEGELNAKILKITMKIKDKYPELSKYLEEMRETIPDVKNPEITLERLKKYYDSLDWMLKKYTLEY